MRSVPLTYCELEKTLGALRNLIGVILGMNHPLTVEFKAMWTLLQGGLQDDLCAAIKYCSYVKPTHILCSIQFVFYYWFAYQCHNFIPPAPN
jgi:hypothetical protein